MSRESLKLTSYFGERERANRGFLADELLDLYGRHALRASVLLRGAEGFGLKHHLQTARLLTLSEDLPVVSVAVDTRERIEGVLGEVTALTNHGLVTLERALLVTEGARQRPALRDGDAVKLTVYLGRQQRLAGRAGHLAVVELLHDLGVDGATVLLGVDGTFHGERRRARFLASNGGVPLMAVAVGDPDRIAAATNRLTELVADPLMTVERVRILKRDGRRLVGLDRPPETDAGGLGIWHKLTIYTGEQARHRGRPLYPQLIRRLREAGAMGATALRGIWGYHGDHRPHGDRLRAIRRRVPVVTVVIDTPTRMRRWYELIDELTDETGLVTSELVPAFRASAPETTHGGLHLAEPGLLDY